MSGIFDQVINYAPPSLLLGTVTYKGTWSAATNTPTLANPPSSITNGNYYVVSAAGTQFSLSFNIGDWIISNGTAWEKVDNTDAVSSVFGRMGAVVGVSTDYSAVGITNTALGASNPSTVAATTITATSTIAATGAVTGSNLSGTNTGDQTISLTGGVTGSGTGSFAATVVTNANLTGVITSVGNATSIASQTGTGSTFVVSGSPTITTPVIAQINDASGNETLKLASIASAVNEVTIENAATGNAVHISATGGDASVGLHLAGKGASGYVNVQDSTDATKRIMFNASGGTTNTRTMLSSTQTVDRTLSLPDATDTLVGRTTTDTLTNKTLTSPTITGGALNGTLGATTPSTVAATTVGASGVITSTGVVNAVQIYTGTTTSARYIRFDNGTNSAHFGRDDSTGSVFGTSAYAAFIDAPSGGAIHNTINSVTVTKVTSTGLAVTGVGSFTKSGADASLLLSSSGGSGRDWTQKSTTAGAWTLSSDLVANVLSVTGTGAAITGTLSSTGNLSTTGDLRVTDTGSSHFILIGNQDSGGTNKPNIIRGVNGTLSLGYGTSWSSSGGGTLTSIADISSTGLAITGALSATGTTTLGIGGTASANTGDLFISSTSASSYGPLIGFKRNGSDIGYITNVGRLASTASSDLAIFSTSNVAIYASSTSVLIADVSRTTIMGALELSYSGGVATVQGYDRTGAAYKTLNLSGSTVAMVVNGSGVATFSSTSLAVTGAITATGNITAYFSDDRLKTKLGNIENALNKVCSLDGFYYEANETAQALGYKAVREVGLSAQSVQRVLPEVIAPAPIDPQYMTMHYERVIPLLVEAIKELRAEVAALKKCDC